MNDLIKHKSFHRRSRSYFNISVVVLCSPVSFEDISGYLACKISNRFCIAYRAFLKFVYCTPIMLTGTGHSWKWFRTEAVVKRHLHGIFPVPLLIFQRQGLYLSSCVFVITGEEGPFKKPGHIRPVPLKINKASNICNIDTWFIVTCFAV